MLLTHQIWQEPETETSPVSQNLRITSRTTKETFN